MPEPVKLNVQQLLLDDWEPIVKLGTQESGWAALGQAIGRHARETGLPALSATISISTEPTTIVDSKATRWTLTAIVKPLGGPDA